MCRKNADQPGCSENHPPGLVPEQIRHADLKENANQDPDECLRILADQFLNFRVCGHDLARSGPVRLRAVYVFKVEFVTHSELCVMLKCDDSNLKRSFIWQGNTAKVRQMLLSECGL
jgi:hypothetical protein